MRDLYFVVEGETELEFVEQILIPYFYKQGINGHLQALIITMSGGGHGFNNIQHFLNTVEPVLHYSNQPIVTTLIDFFRLNSETKLPGYSGCLGINLTDDKIDYLQQKLNDAVQTVIPYRFFIPYIQKHEMETLFFSNPEEGFYLEDEKIINDVLAVTRQYGNVEDINGTEAGAPSNRLKAIYELHGQRYEKTVDGINIAELTGIEIIIEKCPRFKGWIENLLHALNNW
ncbi:hypothetical protein AM493_13050 [Flavobacterium akiainvivens]|uniref:DUF4276 family protein n=1 Tax=Flavobacterium akiainvivens TaxID=1202724 RepID=A0A0M9VIN4_9FLAO|nr:DUF4276 family protein [Flavobacterium akiainvivens]KOS06850.1 hypothetical protein AM493_13050 [Flavobacterium akiainvivens]SFQ69153.1 protein of unknown function [Flavobacterium akiainvivens]